MATKTPLSVIALPKGKISALFASALPRKGGCVVVSRGALGFGLPGAVRRIHVHGALMTRLLAQIKALDAGGASALQVEGLGAVRVKLSVLTSPHALDEIQIDVIGQGKR